ncbi:MAG: prepilin-type N-terminal cleavage/methylation domain-containing protein [FCB group bacterium]|jgi:type II secretion system protein H|nr:prepilin-type N-terminal cleavage/methylation domain-containing protein [FCB group bacterium]
MRLPEVKKAPCRLSRGGFSLLELMVVLMMITLFSTLIVPSVVTATREDAVSTQRDKVAELLRFANLTAITRHHPVQVYVNSSSGVCRVALSQTALPWLEEQTTIEVLESLRLPDSIRIDLSSTDENAMGDAQCITFYSDGRADGSLVTLTDSRGERGVIEVMGSTGEVFVREEERP